MATRNYVPRADSEGTIGTMIKFWLGGFFRSITVRTSTTTVAASATEALDTLTLSESKTCRWQVNLESTTASKSFCVIARARNSDAAYTKYAIVGESLDHTLNVSSDGSTMTLYVTNNESVEITAIAQRMQL